MEIIIVVKCGTFSFMYVTRNSPFGHFRIAFALFFTIDASRILVWLKRTSAKCTDRLAGRKRRKKGYPKNTVPIM